MTSANSPHLFHIPVMGIGYTIDTPLKVARYGINSALSIMDDQLIERMRGIISRKRSLPYHKIEENEPDARARRITAYLDMLQVLVTRTTYELRRQPFIPASDITRYFEMLPPGSPAVKLFRTLTSLEGPERLAAEETLRGYVRPGAIEVNIMTKVDKPNRDRNGVPLPPEYSDALSALRGFAMSGLDTGIVFSAGLNPRLYSYCEKFPDFFPAGNALPKKRIIIKVSDFRSALVQGKFLAKKGLWVSEFRVESGLNCGGHAFATEGMLMGPILEEFARRRTEMAAELHGICATALLQKGIALTEPLPQRITAQGGLGTAAENEFLLRHYGLDSVGWGSPFLLAPEVTNVDQDTLRELSQAVPGDYFLSHASPLGVPFNNFRKSSSEVQRNKRIANNRPGSPCYKKFLAFNTEFSEKPVCTASREYQRLKLAEIERSVTNDRVKEQAIADVLEKDCLCEGLGVSAVMVNGEVPDHKLTAVTICPGPNLAYFSGVYTLKQMTDHIYGRTNILNKVPRPHVFVNELRIYVDYLQKEIDRCGGIFTLKQQSGFTTFADNLLEGIGYYRQILPEFAGAAGERERTGLRLDESERVIAGLKRGLASQIPA